MADFENNILLTLDVDWAPDFVINEIASILIDNEVKATWFVTHNSAAIEYLRQYPELFELGIHPNFYPGSTHGKTEDEVMTHICSVVPGAISMRTHGLYQNTNYLVKAAQKFGIKIDVSMLLLYTPNIQPHYLRFKNSSHPLFRIPFFWEDDLELFSTRPEWDLNDQKYNQPGIRIFNFHPIHIALNSCSYDPYESLGAKTSIPKCTPNDIREFKNLDQGAETLFLQLVQKLSGRSKQIKELLL